MVKRYSIYHVASSVELLWDRSLVFWRTQRGRFKEFFQPNSPLYRRFVFKHDMSMHIYGTSWGEQYIYQFYYDAARQITHICIEVHFSWMGRGLITKVPEDYLKSWAQALGLQYCKFAKYPDADYLHFIYKVEQGLASNSETSQTYCKFCNELLESDTRYCPQCGKMAVEFQIAN